MLVSSYTDRYDKKEITISSFDDGHYVKIKWPELGLEIFLRYKEWRDLNRSVVEAVGDFLDNKKA